MSNTELFIEIMKYGTPETVGAFFKIVDAIEKDRQGMKVSDFIGGCTACGGDWASMIYSGIKRFYPSVYDAIPIHVANNGTHNFVIATMIAELCGVPFSKAA